jgi:hypothetical protein
MAHPLAAAPKMPLFRRCKPTLLHLQIMCVLFLAKLPGKLGRKGIFYFIEMCQIFICVNILVKIQFCAVTLSFFTILGVIKKSFAVNHGFCGIMFFFQRAISKLLV